MILEHKYTTEELIKGCRRGDRRSQELLYRSMASKMLGLSQRYAADEDEAVEILQTGFIKVFSQIEQFRSEGAFEGWVRRIMVTTAIEFYRKRRRRVQEVDLDERFELGQEGFVMDHLEVEDLMALIKVLPEGYRLVFNMYAIEGYSHREIAQALQISEGASKSQLSRARQWLRERLKKMEGDNYGTHAG